MKTEDSFKIGVSKLINEYGRFIEEKKFASNNFGRYNDAGVNRLIRKFYKYDLTNNDNFINNNVVVQEFWGRLKVILSLYNVNELSDLQIQGENYDVLNLVAKTDELSKNINALYTPKTRDNIKARVLKKIK